VIRHEREAPRDDGDGDDARVAAAVSPDPEVIRELVLRALERRRRTRSELATLLRRKGVKAVDFDPVLDRLTEVGLIDDLEYARVYLERRAAGKPRGARLLRNELMAKGVPGALIDQALAERKDDHDPADDAVKALRPKVTALSKLDARTRDRKAWVFWGGRGFCPVVLRGGVVVGLGDGGGEDDE
jgi:regulatory protein